MNILKTIESIIDPVGSIIDRFLPDKQKAAEAKLELTKVQNQISEKVIELQSQVVSYELELAKARSQVITAEAQGTLFIQKAWRPITMLTFLGLVVLDSFGVLAFRLSSEAWTLLQLGLGGYVIGRSFEKIVPGTIGKINQGRK